MEGSGIGTRGTVSWKIHGLSRNFSFPGVLRADFWLTTRSAGDLERHLLLHIVFPDTFEPMLQNDKQRIVRSPEFAKFISPASTDTDRKIQEIRLGLEAQWGRDFGFYDDGVSSLWRNGRASSPWDTVRQPGKGVRGQWEAG